MFTTLTICQRSAAVRWCQARSSCVPIWAEPFKWALKKENFMCRSYLDKAEFPFFFLKGKLWLSVNILNTEGILGKRAQNRNAGPAHSW